MVNALSFERNTTDAAGIIPPRLGIGASAAVFVGTGGFLHVPTIGLPAWIPVPTEWQYGERPEADHLTPMSPPDIYGLLQLDESHNPMLADLWRDDMNDDLVDSP